MNNPVIAMRKLSENDDMNTIARLVFDTDPYIYKDLFGNFENAKIVLPFLFKRNSGIYKYSCYYVATIDDTIAGIAAFFKHDDFWCSEDVRIAFIEAGIKLPDSFDSVCEYFKNTHNYHVGTKACNICVQKEYRRLGIGNYMVQELIKMAGNSNIVLTVLANNKEAIKLYQKNGFKILYEFDDYGGYKKPSVKSYYMVHLR